MTNDQTSDSSASAEPAKTKGFGETYWMCNAIEMWERLAYFGIRAVVPIYIMQATEPGGLHLTAQHKGWIYAWWAVFQSFLPMVTGGYADRYGYKRVLGFAISMNVVGYVIMAYLHSYYGFFAGILVLATGTAFFKPALQGSIAQALTKENSSLGWGIFYWVVNIGAFGAPFIATIILGKPHSAEGWHNLFLASAAFTAVNLLLLFFFKDVPSGASKTESPLEVLARTIKNVVEPRLICFLLIMSCFWLMMYQLWDLHPNFIEDWIDSSGAAAHVPFEAWKEYGDRGIIRVPQQILLNLNAGLIILLVLPISWLVRKMRTLSAMLIGMSVATSGILIAGLTGNGWILLLGIVFFSLGEMLTGPKKNQYLGLIAPPGKKGMYLGYVNIPIGIGVGIGSWLAGHVYGNFGEKASLALDHLADNTQLVAQAAQAADWSDSLEKIPLLLNIERQDAFDLACAEAGMDAETTGDMLRRSFKYDQGQIVNLGLQYLALDPDFRDKTVIGLSPPARFVHLLPDALGRKRVIVFETVRERMNEGRQPDNQLTDTEIIEALWAQFGHDPENLNNLALEYLAQGTDRIHDAVAAMTFDSPPDDLKGRTKEIEKRLGIGRTKSFAALSVALGADEAAVEEALSKLPISSDDPNGRVYTYLINQPHHRFIAIAQKDWTKDVDFLRELIESDQGVAEIVAAEIDKQAWYQAAFSWVRSIFALNGDAEKTIAERLANKQDLIQKALDVKDWSKTPDQATRLLGLNPFEARALTAAEVNQARITATELLWTRYHPQYYVWIPFAAIGVAAIIALAIFGQMAKRWKDMNA